MKILTPKELETLTGYKRPSAQSRTLQEMKVPHRVRPDGKIIVVDVDLPMGPRPDDVVLNL